MKTILLATGGSYGDVAPFLSLARELRARGARPILLVNPAERPHVERYGLEARWVGATVDLAQLVRDNPHYMGWRGGEYVIREMFAPFARLMHPVAADAIREERPACVVSHLGCFGSIWAAWQGRVPSVVVHLAPVGWFSADHLRAYPWWQRILLRGLLPLVLRRFDAFLRPVARDLGITETRGLLRKTLQEADLVLGLWSPTFRPALPGDPPRSRLCGFVRPPDADDPLPAAVASFLDQGEPPIAFGLGTSAVHVPGHFFAHAAGACRRLGRRGLCFTGRQSTTHDRGDMLAVAYAPYDGVFARCAAAVHHGGIGTSAAVLRAGIGCVTVPFAHDQFENALHLNRLGLSRTRLRSTLTEAGLARSLEAVLAESVKRRGNEVAARLCEETDGAAVAADAILSTFA